MAEGYSVDIYRLSEDEQNKKTHTIVSARFSDDQPPSKRHIDDYYNIAMFDTSGSMGSYATPMMNQWNSIMSPVLRDSKRTDIYTFDCKVCLRRSDTFLIEDDLFGGSTDLLGAIKTIYKNVNKCRELNVRIFLITDGAGNEDPTESLAKMTSPTGKNVEVYLVGVGCGFPVTLSVGFRSTFHTGSASCPTLFWAQMNYRDSTVPFEQDFENEFRKISSEIVKSQVKINLSMPGQIVPQITETATQMSLGEFMYYEGDPIDVSKTLQLSIEGDNIKFESVINISLEFLMGRLFKQWNAVLIQRFNNKKTIPHDVFDLMERCFENYFKRKFDVDMHDDSILNRILKKEMRSVKFTFATMMSESKKIILLKEQYRNEIELAHAILKTTVQSRYDDKILRYKGHSCYDWEKDLEAFKKIYNSIEKDIKALPETEENLSCSVLSTSFLSDLQDSDFVKLFVMNKPDFLNTLNFTGIPIYAPIKDSAQINPWTLSVKHILISPFEVISQRVLETWYESENLSEAQLEERSNKEVTLQESNPSTTFNVVVPIIPPEHCALLKKLVRTNVFSAGATFCILKNPLIIDNHCHLAALACTWLKTITETTSATLGHSQISNNQTQRPEYIARRLECIEATAHIYLDRPDVKSYINALLKTPWQAMITESQGNDDHVLKCESIVKPVFFIHMMRGKKLAEYKIPPNGLIQMVLVEFLGRTIPNESKTPYIDFCLQDTKSLHEKIDNAYESLNYSAASLLNQYFCPEDLFKNIEDEIRTQVDAIVESECLKPCPNMNQVLSLYNGGRAGNIKWKQLRLWAQELSHCYGIAGQQDYLTQDMIKEIFSADQILAYVNHALKFKKSTERWPGLVDFTMSDEIRHEICKQLKRELGHFVKENLFAKTKDRALKAWTQGYMDVHQNMAQPLSRRQIVQKATARGVDVTEESFDKIYKYRAQVGLCRNCCHVEACPHFLVPDNRFNCHLEAERIYAKYPHKLHVISSASHEDVPAIITQVQNLITEKSDEMKIRKKTEEEKQKKKQERQEKSYGRRRIVKRNEKKQNKEESQKKKHTEVDEEVTFPLVSIVEKLSQIYKELIV